MTRTEIASEINQLFRSSSRLTLWTRERIGKLLIDAQGLTPKGSFGEWIRLNLPFDHIRANQFMRIYRESIGVQPAAKPRPQVQPEVKTEYVYVPKQGDHAPAQLQDMVRDLSAAHAELDRLRVDNQVLLKFQDESRKAKIKINQLEREIIGLRMDAMLRGPTVVGGITFSVDEARIIRASLHPDRPERSHEQLTKAAQIFNSKVK